MPLLSKPGIQNCVIGFVFILGEFSALTAQTVRPLQSQAPSTISVSAGKEGSQAVEIHNVSYQVTGTSIPGRPANERLLLRKTTHSKWIIGDEGSEGTVSLEAWPLGTDLRQKALYTLKVTGGDGQIVDNSLFVASRGLEEVEWWSIYRLSNAKHLFDTYVPLVSFSIVRSTVNMRYVGYLNPGSDSEDARLKDPHVIGVLIYATEDAVMRRLILTCDDEKRAALLRSYADTTRKLTFEENASGAKTLRLVISENFPSPANPTECRFPIVEDELNPAKVQMPDGFHAKIWQ
ncbi:MAG TPA: hypothetical protein VGL53_25140 [Bryobacteraceae bacterium]